MEQNNNRLARLVRSYEEKLEQGVPFYMEAADLADIVEYYTGQGRDYDAETCLRMAQALHPDDIDLNLQRAYILKNAGKWKEAMAVVESIDDPSHRSRCMFMAEHHLATLSFEEAVQSIDKLLQATPEGFELYDTMEEAAEIFFDYGFFDQALCYLNRIPHHYEQYARCQGLKADCLFHKKQPQEATAILNEIIDASPYDDQLWTIMADGQYKNALYDAAVESCEYALAINPENSQAERIRILSMFQVRPIAECLPIYRKYISKYSNDYVVAMTCAECAFDAGETELTLIEGKRAYASVPLDSADRSRIIRVVLLSLIKDTRVDEVLSVFQGTSIIGVQFNETHCDVAEHLVKAGYPEVAVSVLHMMTSSIEVTEAQVCRIANIAFALTFVPAARLLWEEIYQHHASPSVIAQTAVVFRRLHHPLFCEVLAKAIDLAPQYVQAYFLDIYPGLSPADMLREAQKEQQGWG